MAKRCPIHLVMERPAVYTADGRKPVRTSADMAALVRSALQVDNRETCIVIGLDQKHAPLACEIVSTGTLTASLVHPREVFRPLVLMQAAAFALAHNHPSGDPAPSAEDAALCARLKAAADTLGIRFLDSLTIGAGTSYYSMADNGRL